MTVWMAGILLLLTAAHTAGQGLRAGESTTLGSSGSSASLQQLYARSKAMRRSWRQTRGTTTSCKSASGGAVLCGSDTADSSQAYAALWLATSPAAYSSHVPDNTGGVRLFTPPQTQGDCNSCTAFAMAAALQAAVAWGLQIDAAKANVSVQAMYFGCSAERGPMLDCSSGSTLTAAAEAAVQRAPRLPLADCLPYKPDVTGELSEAELCHGSCTTTNPFVAQGKLRVTKLGSIWQAQRHILQYGSVASRFDVHDDLQPFYADKANARKVYRKTDGAKLLFAHAVALVGYNNDEEYWIVRNSWGPSWADGGYFRVAYGSAGILTEAYGLVWTPHTTPAALQLPVVRVASSPSCYWYVGRKRDHLSRVAWQAGVPLEKFMLDNAGSVADLDATVKGARLLLCNPRPGNIVVRAPGEVTGPSAAPATPAAQPPPAAAGGSSDPQLAALLELRKHIDKHGVLKWSVQAGAGQGYCDWRQVACSGGAAGKNRVITGILLCSCKEVAGLQGTLPPASVLRSFPGLTDFSVTSQPGVSGTLPSDWSSLNSLVDIRIGNTSVSGTLPASWSQLKLKQLHLYSNKLTGPLPETWSRLSSLQKLDLAANPRLAPGPLPASWVAGMRALEDLRLYNASRTGPLPSDFASTMPKLTYLDLEHNALTGPLPALPPTLEKLWLNGNRLSGRLDPLAALTRLRVLVLDNNAWASTLPAAFKDLALERLILHNASITGTLPDVWSQGALAASLQRLDLSRNALTGTLPASWFAFGRLHTLYLGRTRLAGTLPAAWGTAAASGAAASGMRSLTSFSIASSSNSMSGTVPPSWSALPLDEAYLWGNAGLRGCLPSAWAKGLANDFDVARDALDGTGLTGFCSAR